MVVSSGIAAQMYTLREFCKTPADIARTLARVKKLGYHAIQASGMGPIPAADLAKILADEGLVCCATHVSLERLLKEPQVVAEEHHILACQRTAIPIAPVAYRSSAAGYIEFANLATQAARTLKGMGVEVSYHNHSFEFVRFGKRTALEIIYDHADAECLGAEIDTYWVQHGGGDPAFWIEKLGPRQPLLHLKDMVIYEDKQIMAEVGEGNINWPRVLAAAASVGVQWYIIEQDTCQRDPFDSLKISLENLRAMGIS
jgi:sugar phosphate isomerase/epimerase